MFDMFAEVIRVVAVIGLCAGLVPLFGMAVIMSWRLFIQCLRDFKDHDDKQE